MRTLLEVIGMEQGLVVVGGRRGAQNLPMFLTVDDRLATVDPRIGATIFLRVGISIHCAQEGLLIVNAQTGQSRISS